MVVLRQTVNLLLLGNIEGSIPSLPTRSTLLDRFFTDLNLNETDVCQFRRRTGLYVILKHLVMVSDA